MQRPGIHAIIHAWVFTSNSNIVCVCVVLYHAQMGLQFNLKPLEGVLGLLGLCEAAH